MCASFNDLTEQKFGDWKVLEYVGNRYYRCLCTLCNKTIRDVHSRSLTTGKSTSCGCSHKNIKVKNDLTGQYFGDWEVIEFAGNNSWKCKCSCGTIKNVRTCNLKNGKTQSCGCKKREKAKNTLLDRYGETIANKLGNPREQWQIDAVESGESLKKVILEHFNDKSPTFKQLGRLLNLSRHRISAIIHKYNLENYVTIDPLQSDEELQLLEWIKSICKFEVKNNVRDLIHPYEIDIYIPELKIAIEFNGTYWHSVNKVSSKKYHQQKTIACAKKGIRLIHIFEYEWLDSTKQAKIKRLLYNVVNSHDNKIIYARNTQIRLVNRKDTCEFLNKYHLQSYSESQINLGCYFNNELLGIITFGSPRFNNNYEYEIIRLCWKCNIIVVGGLEKLFKYFINKYNPSSIITYTDISKFTGNSYYKLGFKAIQPNPISDPNYVWVNPNNNNIVLTRYQTQKNKLLKAGLADLGNTETEIMESLGFLQIYDSGNLKLEWVK